MRTPSQNSSQKDQRLLPSRTFRTASFLFALLITIWLPVTAANAQNVLTDGNFDDLEIGTAPDNNLPAGSWELNSRFGYSEDRPEQFSIVPTSSFDPSLAGNSLRIEAPRNHSHTLFQHVFDVIPESPNEIVRASFDAFFPDTGAGTIGGLSLIVGGDHAPFGYSDNRFDRGPHLHWDSRGQLNTVTCNSPSGANCPDAGSNPRIEAVTKTPVNTWQQVQFDIDLVNDTYDLFASIGGESLELIRPSVGLQSHTQEFLDRVVLALFADAPNRGPGIAYLDNISIEVLEKTPGDFNLDGEVNAVDFRALAENFGARPASWGQGDLDGSGSVGLSDAMLLSEIISDHDKVELASLLAPQTTSLAVGQTYTQDFNSLSMDGTEGSLLPTAWSVTDQHGAVRRIETNYQFPVTTRLARETVAPIAISAGTPEGEQSGDRALALYKPNGGQDDPAAIQLLADTEDAASAVQLAFSIEAWDRVRSNRVGDEAKFDVSIEIDTGEDSEFSSITGGDFTELVNLGTVTTGGDLAGTTGGFTDGNGPDHRIDFASEILHADIPAGSRLRFRWETSAEADASDYWVFGVDDVSITLAAAGDTNLDGEVKFDDFLALSANFGKDGGWAEGDFDGNGQVDFPDFLALSANFGQSISAAAAVPEPTASLMAAFAVLDLISFRKRR